MMKHVFGSHVIVSKHKMWFCLAAAAGLGAFAHHIYLKKGKKLKAMASEAMDVAEDVGEGVKDTARTAADSAKKNAKDVADKVKDD